MTAHIRVGVYSDPPLTDVVRALEFAGLEWTQIRSDVELMNLDGGVDLLVVELGADLAEADRIIAAAARQADRPCRVLALARGAQLDALTERLGSIADFMILPFHPAEADVRIKMAIAHVGQPTSGDAPPPTPGLSDTLIVYDDLVLNLETYQAHVAGHALDLTFMEYELLKYLASQPGRVFSRETLLSHVWGYEYFGGARTVDVHVRRVRAKLGEERARLIQTVRSVGYRFGESSWDG